MDDPSTAAVDETMQEFTIKPPNPDGDRDMDTIMVRAFVAGRSEAQADPYEIEVADIHGLPDADDITAKAYMSDKDGKKDAKNEATSVMEGAEHPVHVTVTADRGTTGYPAGEKLKVTVTGAAGQARDYRVEPSTIEIASGMGEKSATFKLWALEDEDIAGDEMLMLDLTVMGADEKKGEGSVTVPFSIMIEDATMPWVKVKDGAEEAIMMALGDDPLNPEDTVMIMTDDLFMYDADMYSVSFAASVDGAAVSASSSGDAVTVMAMEPGESKVTVTATAAPMSSSAVTSSQTRANVAQLTFDVSVVMSDLSVTVTADPMEIMEGGMSTITATASREVAASDGDVKVDLEVIGDGELSASSITIAAGEMTGTATVTATEDDDYDDETLTVVARGAGSATLTIMVDDKDDAPEPTNVVTAKSSDEIYPMLMAAGLAGDDAMFNPGMMAELDASMMFTVMEGYSASYGAESDAMNVASPSTMGSMVTVTAGEAGMAHVTITATATMASGVMTGQPATNVATVMFPVNVTNTPLAITVSTDPMDMVEEGGTITVTATANRDVVADDGDVQVTLTITGAVEMNEATIAIAAGSSNSTMVQVLDDMEVAPMADITIVATGSGIATAQTFTISVTENDSPRTFTLSAPEDMMNLVEGGDGVELTVTADPAVSEDTEVMIMVDRAASTADADDFTAAAVMISAGKTSGTTMLMATEDDMPDSGHGSPEMLVVFAMADNTQSNTVSFYIWDMAVPALPLIAQLLLAAFLAVGGYRRYRRR